MTTDRKSMIAAAMTVAVIGALFLFFNYAGVSILAAPDVLSPVGNESTWSLVDRVSATTAAYDQLQNLLTSAAFGLVVMVGLALKIEDVRSFEFNVIDYIAAILFLAAIALTMFLAYGGRLRLFEVMIAGSVDLQSLKAITTLEAFCVGGASIPAFYMVARSLFAGKKK